MPRSKVQATNTVVTARQKAARGALVEHIRSAGLAVGDQIESFHALARHLGISLALLQKVVRMLERDGLLTVVPRVGTFVGRVPAEARRGEVPAGAPALPFGSDPRPTGKTVLRFYAAESGRRARQYWRRVVSAFEEKHPAVRVHFSMNSNERGPVAGADVVVVETGVSQKARDEFLDWPDGALPEASSLVEPLADFMAGRKGTRSWPILLTATLTFASKGPLARAGLYAPERWRTPRGIAETCDEYFARPRDDGGGMLGWGFHNLSMPLFYMGFSRRKLGRLRSEVEHYVRLVADCPPPKLVTLADVTDTDYLLGALREGRILFVTGFFWHNLFVDPEAWEVLPPPLLPGGVPLMGSMSVAARRSTSHPEESFAFARFLAGRRAQRIFAEAGGLLPTLGSAAARHPLYDIFAGQIAGGWLRTVFEAATYERSEAMRTLGCLAEVRTRGLDPEEAITSIMSYEPGTEFVEVVG